jgi:uncharacterized protein (DUF608 family)
MYTGQYVERIAFPIGGMGAGMFCLEGSGAISHMSVHNNPDVFNEPVCFAAIAIKGHPSETRVLEGPVPDWKKFGMRDAGIGSPGKTWGLARFQSATFLARFPFADISLTDTNVPVQVKITAWSPFIPTDADNSSLPVGALEYHFKNTSQHTEEYIFSFNARNFMAMRDQNDNISNTNCIQSIPKGFILRENANPQNQDKKGDFAIFIGNNDSVIVDHCWFRGGWFDPLTMAWNHIQQGITNAVNPIEGISPGASLFVPFSLRPGQEKTIRLLMAWYVPNTHLRLGQDPTTDSDNTVADHSLTLPSPYHKPWYSHRFPSITAVADYWRNQYDSLRSNSALFRDAFYKSNLPPEVLEAVSANLTILKSPTILRQYDGRFWGWEGCNDAEGSCEGSCTHVWNYAQALSHLFPSLERSMRETEFGEDQDAKGHQTFRAALPIRPLAHRFYPAADGQLGGIMKVYRDWRIAGDSAWLKKLFPKVRQSLDYCIQTWDPRHHGALEEPHHNTYDIEFWGAEPMCTGIYLGALQAMIKMGNYLGEDISLYKELYSKGRDLMETQLFKDGYFMQQIQWKGLNAADPVEASKQSYYGRYSEEAIQLLEKEGPKYQYGTGCLSDGMIGDWLSLVCGLPSIVDTQKIKQHLMAVWRYNFKTNLSGYNNPQRSTYALGNEGGLLLCTWPKGGQLSLPFIYSDEVWTGIEYEVASHLIFMGRVKEGLDIVQTCRKRYDGKIRNPFDEYECGHWYARAMSSYALLESLTGVRYDAVEKTLYVNSKIGDFTSFIATNTGFGNVVFRNGKASIQTVYGSIPVDKIIIGK